MVVAVALNEGFYNFKLQIWRGKSIVMLFDYMDNKLTPKPTDSHCDNIGIWDFTFDPTKQSQKSITRKYIVQIFVGKNNDPLLLFISMVHLYKFGR